MTISENDDTLIIPNKGGGIEDEWMKTQTLKMKDSVVKKDLIALEEYRMEKISFEELVKKLQRNNGLDYLSKERVRRLLHKSGFERGM